MADAAPKISLLDMIIFAETEAGDIDIWEDVLAREGQPLYAKMAKRRTMLRKITATLELVKRYEKQFIDLVQKSNKRKPAASDVSDGSASE